MSTAYSPGRWRKTDPSPKGTTDDDCVIRSISLYLGKSYGKTKAMIMAFFDMYNDMREQNGIGKLDRYNHNDFVLVLMSYLGFSFMPCIGMSNGTSITRRMKVTDILADTNLPEKYIVLCDGHLTYINKQIIYDQLDCSNYNAIAVYVKNY